MEYILMTVAFATAFYLYSNYTFTVKNLEVQSERFPKEFHGFKIAHLSDLHNTFYGKRNEKLIEAVRRISPDVIFYTGDMIDKTTLEESSLLRLLEPLAKEFPAYYIPGNHEDDLNPSEKEKLIRKLKELDVSYLENERSSIVRNGQELQVYGLHLPRRYLRNTYDKNGRLQLSADKISRCVGSPGEDFSILLAHNPLYFKAYAEYGADLTLSGHVHGGLVRLPIIGGLLSPDRVLNPAYDKGLYDHEGHQIIVSPGLGGVRLRFFNRPVIYAVTLRKTES